MWLIVLFILIVGFLPLIIVYILFKTTIVLDLIENHNRKIKLLNELQRTDRDQYQPKTIDCLMKLKNKESFDTELYFSKGFKRLIEKPLNVKLSFEQVTMKLQLSDSNKEYEKKEYHIPYCVMDKVKVNGILVKYTEASMLEISSNTIELFDKHKDLYFHFQTPKELEYFYSTLKTKTKQQLSSENFSEQFGILLRRIDSYKSKDSLHWFYGVNYLAHRIFFTFYNNKIFLDLIKKVVQDKLNKKMESENKPSFIESIRCESFIMGMSLPVFCDPSTRIIENPQKVILEALIHYIDGFEVKVNIKMKVLFKTVYVTANVKLKHLDSIIYLVFQSLPTYRIWFSFGSKPNMDLKIDIPTFNTQNLPEKLQIKLEDFINDFVSNQVLKSFIYPCMQEIELPEIKF